MSWISLNIFLSCYLLFVLFSSLTLHLKLLFIVLLLLPILWFLFLLRLLLLYDNFVLGSHLFSVDVDVNINRILYLLVQLSLHSLQVLLLFLVQKFKLLPCSVFQVFVKLLVFFFLLFTWFFHSLVELSFFLLLQILQNCRPFIWLFLQLGLMSQINWLRRYSLDVFRLLLRCSCLF